VIAEMPIAQRDSSGTRNRAPRRRGSAGSSTRS
jgi:hypothetical protein